MILGQVEKKVNLQRRGMFSITLFLQGNTEEIRGTLHKCTTQIQEERICI